MPFVVKPVAYLPRFCVSAYVLRHLFNRISTEEEVLVAKRDFLILSTNEIEGPHATGNKITYTGADMNRYTQNNITRNAKHLPYV